jgi:pimeloyl-ACP methyl ester carboxylesterase
VTTMPMSRAVELSAGRVAYQDTGGDGPPVVLLAGLLMDSSLWDDVIAALAPGVRCIAPTLPMGAHRDAMSAEADLSPLGLARLVAELLDRLALDDVTLVGNDTGGALVQLVATDPALARRVSRIVLVSCDAFDNFPPGLTGKAIVLSGKLPPPLFGAFMQQMRIKPLRRMPFAFGWLTKRGDAATARWLQPVLKQRAIRRDAVRVLRGMGANRRLLVDVAERFGDVAQPALIVWAGEDRVMPPEHGRRLAALLPAARLVEIADTYTLIPLDQPVALAEAIERFVGASDRSEARR